MYKIITTMLFLLAMVTTNASAREKRNFNGGWLLKRGDITAASAKKYDDTQWKRVTLPYAFNGDEAFRKDIVNHTDTVV